MTGSMPSSATGRLSAMAGPSQEPTIKAATISFRPAAANEPQRVAVGNELIDRGTSSREPRS